MLRKSMIAMLGLGIAATVSELPTRSARARLGGGIVIIRPDGTGKRVIAAPPIGGLSWSPDGDWLLGGNVDGGPLQLIDTRTDVAVFLPVKGVYPVWKPSGAGMIASFAGAGVGQCDYHFAGSLERLPAVR